MSNNSVQARPTQANSIVAYNQSLKKNAKTAGYFGDSKEAQAKREQFLTKYYNAVLNGNADSIDKFELDAVKMNISEDTAAKIYSDVSNKFQKNMKASNKSFRIFNGENVENQVLQDLRNYKNFRSSIDSINYKDERLDPINPTTFLSPAKSYMMSENDFLFSDKIEGPTFNGYNTNSDIIPIILNEFQPERVVYTTQKLIGTVLGNIGSKILNSKAVSTIAGGIGTSVENAMAEMVSRNPNVLYDLNSNTMKSPNPMKSILNLFPNGRWLNVYQLPFFGSEYLKSDQYTNWQTGDLSQQLGDDVNKFIKDRNKHKFTNTSNISIIKYRSSFLWHN